MRCSTTSATGSTSLVWPAARRRSEPGGHLLVARANAVVDDPSATGFDWQVGFAAKRIGEVLALAEPRVPARAADADLPRAAVPPRRRAGALRPPQPREVILAEAAELGGLEASFNRDGCCGHSDRSRQRLGHPPICRSSSSIGSPRTVRRRWRPPRGAARRSSGSRLPAPPRLPPPFSVVAGRWQAATAGSRTRSRR